jgi:hypothetical protein
MLSTVAVSRRTPDDALPDGDSPSESFGSPESLGSRESLALPGSLVRLDLELLGFHLVVTCFAAYAAAQLGVGAWRGVVVGLVAYTVALLRHPPGRRS